MKLIAIDRENAAQTAPLVAAFRVELRSYKGISSQPDCDEGLTEMLEYLDAGFPAFAAVEDGAFLGYIVCRENSGCVWVESLYVREDSRRRGIASALFDRAEEIGASYGGDTLFNYVHPNNQKIIAFLRKRGYTVLNLIELRKPWNGEKLTTKIQVGENQFDY